MAGVVCLPCYRTLQGRQEVATQSWIYDWWLNILKDGQQVEVHHRYWVHSYIGCLCCQMQRTRDEVTC